MAVRKLLYRTLLLLPIIGLPSVAAASASDSDIATLYRSSTVIENARIHVATFDANERTWVENNRFAYNWENCQIAAELFQKQPGVSVRYWCEKGRYRE